MDSGDQTLFIRSVPAFTALFFLATIPVLPANAAMLSYLPQDAKPVGSLRLCMAPGHEAEQYFACRDYRASDGDYSVLFQGGRIPRVLLKRSPSGEPVARKVTGLQEPWDFDLTLPSGVPLQARHVGTGVCTDPQKRLVPCAVFWETSAIRGEILSYLVLYDPLGGGPLDIDVLVFNGTTVVGGMAGR